MKKCKILVILIIIILSTTMLGGIFIRNINKDYELNISETNLANKAIISGNNSTYKRALDGNSLTSWVIKEKQAEIIFEFESREDINMILINELGLNITLYSIYYLDEVNSWKLCYKQNEIGQLRLATFNEIRTTRIRIVINDFNNIARISNIEIYKIQKREVNDFRFSTYITNISLDDYDNQPVKLIDPNYFDAITDAILFGNASFNTNGDIITTENDNSEKLREIIGSRPTNLFVTILNPTDETATTLSTHKEKLIDNIVNYIVDNEYYGVDFDWEFPKNKKEYDIYSDFLVDLKTELLVYDKKLSLALAPWGLKFSKEAIDCIDQVQIMSYDLYDQNGDNNSFNGTSVNTVNYMLSKGFKLEQLNMGISYYGRPNDASYAWYDYNDPRFHPEEYIMFENGTYFNTITTSRDRTVFSILRGLGGIMTFALHEDLEMEDPLSLTAEIGNSINEYTN